LTALLINIPAVSRNRNTSVLHDTNLHIGYSGEQSQECKYNEKNTPKERKQIMTKNVGQSLT